MEKKGLLIFDMDGVLVDVTDSYRAAIVETVKHFTGTVVTDGTIQDAKNEGGWNDDWLLSQHLIRKTGKDISYDETVAYFQHIFHEGGLMQRERWIAKKGMLEKLAETHTLSVFTGRLRWEANLTLDRFCPGLFQQVVGVDDVEHPKPAPDGILRLSLDIPHSTLRFVGDSIDDALSAKAARVPFIGIAAPANPRYRELAQILSAERALAVLDDINQLPQVISNAA
jgi:HAD superfamily phosphatase